MRFLAVVVVSAFGLMGCGGSGKEHSTLPQEALKRIETGAEQVVEHSPLGHHEYSLTNDHNQIRHAEHEAPIEHPNQSSSSANESSDGTEGEKKESTSFLGRFKSLFSSKKHDSLDSDSQKSDEGSDGQEAEGAQKPKKEHHWSLFGSKKQQNGQ